MRPPRPRSGSHAHQVRFQSLPQERDLVSAVRLFQALSDLTRAKVVFSLLYGERSVNEIAAAVAASPSSVSHHLRRLRDAGLVEYHRHGNQIFYSIEDAHISAILYEAQNHADHRKRQQPRATGR